MKKTKLFSALLLVLTMAGMVFAQSGLSPDSMTLEIASYDSQIESIAKKEDVIQQEIANYVETYKTTQMAQRQKKLDDYLRKGYLSDSDYKAEVKKLKSQIESESKEKYSEKVAEYQEELDELGSQKKTLQDERNRVEQTLLRQTFVIRSNQVNNSNYDARSKSINVVVTIPEFNNEIVTVKYQLNYPGANALEYAEKAAAEKQKTYVADVSYRIKKADSKGVYIVYITGVALKTSRGEEVTAEDDLNQESKMFKAGKLGVSDKKSSVSKTTKVASVEPSKGGNQDAFLQIKQLLDHNKIFDVQDQVMVLSPNCSISQRETLYTNYKKSGVGPFFLNLLPGGIGSFVQGDVVQGIIITAIEAGSVLLMLCDLGPDSSGLLMSIGALTYLGGTVYGCISPWVYSSKWNKALNFALNPSTASFSVLPLIDPVNNQYGIVGHLSL